MLLADFINETKKNPCKITPLDAGNIRDLLSREQRDYADAPVEYLSTDVAELGNRTSKKLYGIAKFTENYLYSQPGIGNEQRLA